MLSEILALSLLHWLWFSFLVFLLHFFAAAMTTYVLGRQPVISNLKFKTFALTDSQVCCILFCNTAKPE
jgi:hypothetical protein